LKRAAMDEAIIWMRWCVIAMSLLWARITSMSCWWLWCCYNENASISISANIRVTFYYFWVRNAAVKSCARGYWSQVVEVMRSEVSPLVWCFLKQLKETCNFRYCHSLFLFRPFEILVFELILIGMLVNTWDFAWIDADRQSCDTAHHSSSHPIKHSAWAI
jgi:hypothetical protein